MAELSLWLDTYSDIYSDFDSRHYLKRRISEDFVEELRAALKYKVEKPDVLVLLLPSHLREASVEEEIASSVKEQIRGRLETLKNKSRKVWSRGLALLTAGVMIMVIDSIISYRGKASYFTGLLKIILEPAGWFMIWNGLDFLLYEFRAAKREIRFYQTIEQLGIHFKDA